MTTASPLSRRRFVAVAGVAAGLAGSAATLALADTSYPLPVNLSGLVPGTTTQVVLAVANRYGSARAVVSAWRRHDGVWTLAQGPFPSWIGVGGFARPARKREGDGRSPTGSFAIPLAFGTRTRPAGMQLPYHRLRSPYEIWVENPRSRYYNELVDVRAVGYHAVGDRESALTYPLGAFIAYNAQRVRGAGSAIFLHPSHGSPTIGCVSIPLPQLSGLLQSLTPQSGPRIVMGVQAELRSLGGPIRTPPRPAPTPTAPSATPSTPSATPSAPPASPSTPPATPSTPPATPSTPPVTPSGSSTPTATSPPAP